MKLYKQVKFWAFSTMVIAVGYLASCTKGNQVLDLPTPTPTPTTNSSKDLVSVKVTTAPTIDGTIDAIWDQATKLNIKPTVPDPGNNLFTGYIGDAYPVTLRSVYDDTYVYFLAEYADNTKSTNVQPWYFNSKTKLWAQEPNSRQFDANGALTRVGFAEDKIAMLFNIDNSTSKFASQTCYSSCHVFTPYMDYSTTTPTYREPRPTHRFHMSQEDGPLQHAQRRHPQTVLDNDLHKYRRCFSDWKGIRRESGHRCRPRTCAP